MNFLRLWVLTSFLSFWLFDASAALAEVLPKRQTSTPITTNGVPHTQLNVQPVPQLSDALLARVERLPGVVLGPTRVSLPGAIGFQLREDMVLAHPEVIVGGNEFAHLHPDGSLHASLEPMMAELAINAGWAVLHPWSQERDGWEGFVLIFTPTNEEELDVVVRLIESSYSFVTGLPANRIRE